MGPGARGMVMGRRAAIASCLIFSGLSALVYQVIWTRLLGFAFGTTTAAIGSVLAVFFGGLALGNWIAARRIGRVRRPLRVYALLELFIGLWALVSLPVLQRLDVVYALLGPDARDSAVVVVRLAAATLLLLPPTLAMGATLPVVARALVGDDRTLGRSSALLYTANTLGAVLGAYLCGFWLVPLLGLERSVWMAVAVNLTVAAFVLAVGGGVAATRSEGDAQPAPESPSGDAPRRVFLALFGVSGFVAIGYEIVWSKLLGIVMEGTLYGFAAVLSAYLLGIALGSLAIAGRVDRIRDLPRAFALLHVAIGVAVSAGTLVVPYLPFALQRLAAWQGGGDAIHLLLLVAAPIVILPAALFGAAFPVLIRIYTRRAARVGEGIGVATAVNTAGSIVASLVVGFYAIPSLGLDATLYALVLIDLSVALGVLARYQSREAPARSRGVGLIWGLGALLLVAGTFAGAQADRAIAGRSLPTTNLEEYRRGLARIARSLSFVAEGKSSIVTVQREASGRTLKNNGLPEAGLRDSPPYLHLEEVLLGVLPYLIAGSTDRALVVGLGGGNTVDALRMTEIGHIDVVELEQQVIEALPVVYEGRESPLTDPRVSIRVNDGRNELLRGRYRRAPRYDVIASQPSHPWLAGAANLFTEEYFELARDNLSPRGVFALWVNGFRIDDESVLAILTSFERAMPGSVLIDAGVGKPNQALILLGGREPVRFDLGTARARLAAPALQQLLDGFSVSKVEDLLARSHGSLAAFARIDPGASNTDDNAFVEARIPRFLGVEEPDFLELERSLAHDASVLPPIEGNVDVGLVARSLLGLFPGAAEWAYTERLSRLLRTDGLTLDPVTAESLRFAGELRRSDTRAEAEASLIALARREPTRAEPLRELGLHRASRERDFAGAGKLLDAAFQRSGAAEDAFDAARAWIQVDPKRAIAAADRIPREQRGQYPRLVLIEAERALAGKRDRADLQRRIADVLAYRETPEGRRVPGVNRVIARLATAVDDAAQARRFADLDHAEREARASAGLARARRALADQRLDAATDEVAQLERTLPASPQVAELRARLAVARSDSRALSAALAEVRASAATVEEGIGAENRLRTRLGLPLLPMFPAAGRETALAPTGPSAPRGISR